MSSLDGILSALDDCRVLVVDDTAADATLAARILTRAGLADVTTLNDPRLVAETLDVLDPDLVLLDLRMPQMSGFEVLDVIRRFAAASYLPVIVVSVDDSAESLQKAFHTGASDYVQKPFNPTELALRVRTLLQNRLAYLELRRSRALLRARLHAFEPDLTDSGLTTDEVRQAIRGVIDSDTLRIAVQPVVDMRDGHRAGGEALSRFPDTTLGGPAGWFAAALEVDLLEELELHALRKTVDALPTQPPGSRLAVNLSPLALARSEDLLASADLPWDRLTLELTEHVPIEDYDALTRVLARLRDAGALVSVDDTGAGFASLRHILELSPDVIKIDIGIIRGVNADPSRQALVEMLVGFTERTGARLVAEGVETEEERDALLTLGVTYGQGRLFGWPELVTTPDE